MVLNTRPWDWESSDLTTRPLGVKNYMLAAGFNSYIDNTFTIFLKNVSFT